MHRIAIWASASLLALATTSALAQNNPPAAPDQNAQVTEQNATNAGATANLTYDQLVAFLNSGTVPDAANAPAGADIASITPDATITVVPISTLEGYSADSTELKDAAAKNAQNLSDLRSQIAGNQTLADKLKASNADPSQVLAITTAGEGSFTVYVDDTAGASAATTTTPTTTTTTTTTATPSTTTTTTSTPTPTATTTTSTPTTPTTTTTTTTTAQ
jgi:hypothetical protein